MNSSDEQLLNRFLDNDLTPEEAAALQLQIIANQELKTRLNEYGQVRSAIGGMPRAIIPEDMVARLAPMLNEPTSLPFFARLASAAASKVVPRWLSGSAALILLSGSLYFFSLVNNQQNNEPVLTRSIESNPSINTSKVLDPPARIDITSPEIKPNEVASISSPKTSVNILKRTSDTQIPADLNSEKLDTDILELVKRLGQIDRRHLVQIHVDVANDRVFNRILRTIEKYRNKDVQVALRRVEEDEETAPKYDFVAIVPTQLVEEMNTELNKMFNGKVELHKPFDERWNDETAEELEPISSETIERALAESDDPQARLKESQGNSPQKPVSENNKKFLTSAEIRKDLYNPKPSVKELAESGIGSSVDEVVVRIRSDAAQAEGNFGRARLNTRRMNQKAK